MGEERTNSVACATSWLGRGDGNRAEKRDAEADAVEAVESALDGWAAPEGCGPCDVGRRCVGADGRSTGPAPKPSEAGYTVPARQLALSNSFGEERLRAIVACLRGTCDCVEACDLQCSRACGNSLHSVCAGVGKSAALGTMTYFYKNTVGRPCVVWLCGLYG